MYEAGEKRSQRPESAVICAADTNLPRLGAPAWTVSAIIVVADPGLLFAVGMAWTFDVTPDGVVRTPALERADALFNERKRRSESEHVSRGARLGSRG